MLSKKLSVIMFFFLISFLLSASEKNGMTSGFNERSFTFFTGSIVKQECRLNNYSETSLMFLSSKTPVKKTGIQLLNRQIAAIVLMVLGTVFLLTGIALLAASLSYSDYLDKKENNSEINYGGYVTGKDASRGLFYGSMGSFGAGVVFITISIPMLVVIKKKR